MNAQNLSTLKPANSMLGDFWACSSARILPVAEKPWFFKGRIRQHHPIYQDHHRCGRSGF